MMSFIRHSLKFIVVAVLGVGLAIGVYAGETSVGPTEHVVEISQFKFVPESVTVKAGDTITWINKDIAPHTATADDLSFDTGELKRNESGSITFTSDQTVSYFCKYHPSMKANLMFE